MSPHQMGMSSAVFCRNVESLRSRNVERSLLLSDCRSRNVERSLLLSECRIRNVERSLNLSECRSRNVERSLPELRSRHAIQGPLYMVYEASAAATASRHSRPESFNNIARQNIGRPHRILHELQFPTPAFWPMADSGATVNVAWDRAYRQLQGSVACTSKISGDGFFRYRRGFSRRFSAYEYIQNQGWTPEHLSSGDYSNYDTWIVPEARLRSFR